MPTGYQANVIAGAPIASTWGNTIRDRSVMVFATTAERDSSIPAPTEGMVCYVIATKILYVYAPPAWRPTTGTYAAFAGTCDANSQLIVTHGAPFTPAAVIIQGRTPSGGGGISFGAAIVMAITATTYTIQVRNAITGAGIGTAAVTGWHLCLP